jgi:hypothetical protein
MPKPSLNDKKHDAFYLAVLSRQDQELNGVEEKVLDVMEDF